MLDPAQFKAQVIEPSLTDLANFCATPALASTSATIILLGTGLIESDLTYLVQLGDGTGFGGHGVYQDEPEDYRDMWANFLCARPNLMAGVSRFRNHAQDGIRQLTTDLTYATVIARMHYWRIDEPLPEPHNAAGLAAYYKTHYNTALGAAQPGRCLAAMQKAIATAS